MLLNRTKYRLIYGDKNQLLVILSMTTNTYYSLANKIPIFEVNLRRYISNYAENINLKPHQSSSWNPQANSIWREYTNYKEMDKNFQFKEMPTKTLMTMTS